MQYRVILTIPGDKPMVWSVHEYRLYAEKQAELLRRLYPAATVTIEEIEP